MGADHVWNFAFGANIDPWKLEKKRGINPLQKVRGVLNGYRLLFNHNGGFGNIEPATGSNEESSLSKKVDHPDEVHGMLLKLSLDDFYTLGGMEHLYET